MNEDYSSRTRKNSWPGRFREFLRLYPRDTQEITDLLRELEHRNLIYPEVLAMIEGALLVSEMQVRDIMLPRAQMVVVPADAGVKEFLPRVIRSGHSRFPVVDDKRDEVLGILLAKDLLAYLAQTESTSFDLWDMLRPAVFVPESKRLNVLLREFRSSRNHMAIVVDEYGRVSGLVTIEDVIEQIVGDISDEHDVGEEGNIRKHRDDRYIVRARTPIHEFNAYFQTGFADEEFDTIGGVILKALGHMPARGEAIEFEGWKFTILRADPRRIHLIRVGRAQEWASEQPQAGVG